MVKIINNGIELNNGKKILVDDLPKSLQGLTKEQIEELISSPVNALQMLVLKSEHSEQTKTLVEIKKDIRQIKNKIEKLDQKTEENYIIDTVKGHIKTQILTAGNLAKAIMLILTLLTGFAILVLKLK